MKPRGGVGAVFPSRGSVVVVVVCSFSMLVVLESIVEVTSSGLKVVVVSSRVEEESLTDELVVLESIVEVTSFGSEVVVLSSKVLVVAEKGFNLLISKKTTIFLLGKGVTGGVGVVRSEDESLESVDVSSSMLEVVVLESIVEVSSFGLEVVELTSPVLVVVPREN